MRRLLLVALCSVATASPIAAQTAPSESIERPPLPDGVEAEALCFVALLDFWSFLGKDAGKKDVSNETLRSSERSMMYYVGIMSRRSDGDLKIQTRAANKAYDKMPSPLTRKWLSWCNQVPADQAKRVLKAWES